MRTHPTISRWFAFVLAILLVPTMLRAAEPGDATAAATQKGRPSATSEPWGTMPDGKAVTLFTLTNANGLRVKIVDRGAAIVSVETPDRAGKLANVTIGPETFEAFAAGRGSVGPTLGRYANRIAGGKFTIDGVEYTLARNNGPNHLHGGNVGFDRMTWTGSTPKGGEGETPAATVTLTYHSRDGEEGYPGNLDVTVRYTLSDDNELKTAYEAVTDKPTYINLSNHCYWNLTGDGKSDALGHVVTIYADQYLPFDAGLIPLGDPKPVRDTPLDFTQPKTIGSRVQQITEPVKGFYDHCYVLNKTPGVALSPAARVVEPTSGRVMEVSTTQPGVQFYTGNRRALCLETQHFPDSPNHPSYPTTLLRPGEKFSQVTVHKFSVGKE
jgi:aldose 1-epimerase